MDIIAVDYAQVDCVWWSYEHKEYTRDVLAPRYLWGRRRLLGVARSQD